MATLALSLSSCLARRSISPAARLGSSLSKAAVSIHPSRARLLTMAEQKAFSTVVSTSAVAGKPGESEVSVHGSPVVSVDWLYQHLSHPGIKVLDASWYMPAEKRNPLEEFKSCHIPGALFFDIDGIVDDSVDLPHMLPSEAGFAAAMSALGLLNTDTIVVYDGKGIFSSARVWWMFRVFGHDKVYVLNGGLPQWRASAYPLELSTSEETLSKIAGAVESARKAISKSQAVFGQFEASYRKDLVWALEQVKRNVKDQTFQHIDARSKARFDGTAEEPRKGIRAGHVPGSKCIPFTEVLDDGGSLLPPNALHRIFKEAGVSLESPIMASCGTGVTACVLALALESIGVCDVPVYDGSWTEWGGVPDTPVATASSPVLL